MKEILGKAKTIRELLGGAKYSIDYYQREYGDLTYEEKLPHYCDQNLLARSLHPDCYDHNPGFLKFIQESGLPFRPQNFFNSEEMEQRCELYLRLTAHIWNPDQLMEVATA